MKAKSQHTRTHTPSTPIRTRSHTHTHARDIHLTVYTYRVARTESCVYWLSIFISGTFRAKLEHEYALS